MTDKRTEEMSVIEYREFLQYVYSFPSKVEASIVLKISRPTLDSIIETGRGKKFIINRIREIIKDKRVA